MGAQGNLVRGPHTVVRREGRDLIRYNRPFHTIIPMLVELCDNMYCENRTSPRQSIKVNDGNRDIKRVDTYIR